MSCVSANDVQLARLADAIAQRVGQQRFHVWFDNSTRLDLRQDGLEIAVPNDFISEWIGKNFTRPIQEAAHEVLGTPLPVRFQVVPELFEIRSRTTPADKNSEKDVIEAATRNEVAVTRAAAIVPPHPPYRPAISAHSEERAPSTMQPRLRHQMETFVVGAGNQLAYNTANYVAEFPGSQYNPLFIHGNCGLGKTHLLQALCRRFIELHPTKRWMYLTGEEFTNEFLTALRTNKLDAFRRKMRDLDLLVIDDVHFLGGKKATQEEFLHTFNAIEAMGRQVVMASDNHPKLIEEFGESLINRFVSGMVVRIDPPNYATRCEILRALSIRMGMALGE